MDTALVVIDDPVVEQVLTASLRSAAFYPVAAADLDGALRVALQFRPDVIIVDVDRYPPEVFAKEFAGSCPQGRRSAAVPMIMLTSDPAIRFGAGLERCLTTHCSAKPVRPKDIVSTAIRLVRRSNARLRDTRWSGVIRRGPIELDLDRFTMTVDLDDRRLPLGLGPTATRLMARLMQRPGTVCGRDELLAQVWPNDATVTARTVDQNIHRLRVTLRRVDLADAIHTVEGHGYSFVLPPARSARPMEDVAGP
jgi:DNA-binding response OmpR family regulator